MKQKRKCAHFLASRFVQDESGFVLPLAIILIMLSLLLGMGLLAFADAGLNSAAQTNRGQIAFDTADAGMQAARRQLIEDENSNHYDGANSDDVQWSLSQGGMNLSFPGNLGSANVTVQTLSENSFAVVSTGSSGDAKRKVASTINATPQVSSSIPPVHFSWRTISWSGGGGSACLGTSVFAIGDINVNGTPNICSTMDPTFGKWAQVGSGSGPYPDTAGSYPNPYNPTPRTDMVAGFASRGAINVVGGGAGAVAAVARGTRSFDRNTCPTLVADYATGSPNSTLSPPCTTKIAFPFKPASSPPPSDTETLRQRALYLEQQNPGTTYYYDSVPGNGIDDPGMTTDQNITTWPSGTNYQTVVFFKFAPSTNKTANWQISASCSNSSPYKGVLTVENGNFNMGGSVGGFNGAIIIRGGGTFNSSGTSCMTGYVNSDGDMTMKGTFNAGTVPPLKNLSAFDGSISVVTKDWREVYTP